MGTARVARLATVDARGVPHLVPVTFVLAGDEAFTAVDAKPKRTTRLKRLDNIRASGLACLLADSYDEDWARLWWVRADASASVLAPGRQAAHAVGLLAAKYEQYASRAPGRPGDRAGGDPLDGMGGIARRGRCRLSGADAGGQRPSRVEEPPAARAR